jgi:hypothetical protein
VVWPDLCRYRCSKIFLGKTKETRGKKDHLDSDDIAQNKSQTHNILYARIFFDILIMDAYFFVHSSFSYLLL